jgi:hypothetical protein
MKEFDLTAELFIVVWLFHLLPLLVIASPVWLLARKQIRWNRWDFAIIIFPFGIWSILMQTHYRVKGMGNLLEGLLIGLIASFAPIIRLIVKDKINQTYFAQGLLIVLCLIAVGIWAFVPGTFE